MSFKDTAETDERTRERSSRDIFITRFTGFGTDRAPSVRITDDGRAKQGETDGLG